jgi:hypothetical protein
MRSVVLFALLCRLSCAEQGVLAADDAAELRSKWTNLL